MNQGDLVSTFIAINGCSESEAINYLFNAAFDLGLAQQLYDKDHKSAQVENPQEIPDSSSAHLSTNQTAPYFVDRLDGGVGNTLHGFVSSQEQSPANVDFSSAIFLPPHFVCCGTTPFEEFCYASFHKDCWVLLSFIADDFVSLCVNRDLWKCEASSEIVNMFSIYQISTSAEITEQMARNYRIDLRRDLPTLLVINPLTKGKETRVPLNMSGAVINVREVNESLLSFVAEHGSPSQWEEKRLLCSPTDTSKHEAVEVVDVPDVMINCSTTKKTSQPVNVVDISPYEASDDTKEAFALRCRLPKRQLTLRLKPETPVYFLLEYLTYCAYKDNPEIYSRGAPNCSLKVGYPPKTLNADDRSLRVGTWGQLRSGDTVFLHFN